MMAASKERSFESECGELFIEKVRHAGYDGIMWSSRDIFPALVWNIELYISSSGECEVRIIIRIIDIWA